MSESIATTPVSLDPLLPAEMAVKAEGLGVAKARMPVVQTFVLAVLAGAFISLGADFFLAVTTDTGLGWGPSRLLGGGGGAGGGGGGAGVQPGADPGGDRGGGAVHGEQPGGDGVG